MIYDVLVIGGGAAGYGCVLTLTSVEKTKDFGKNRNYLMIDSGDSDILKASFFNVAGVDFGIGGDSLLKKMKEQLSKFNSVESINNTVTKIEKSQNGYKVSCDEINYEAKIVVIATGMHKFDIECDLVKIKEHTDVIKPNKICLENKNNKICEGLYVAGLASGAKTMFAIANGEGSKVACDIFKIWTNKPAVAHDTINDKLF
jgi:thioredoxin reductase